ncbi:MAG TPA: hypothetical protein VGD29_18930 [Actinoplanes sp.]|jgi:hypothetical protein
MTYPENADLETPLEDAAEQATSAVPDQPDDDEEESDDAARVVELDDEYR